jgi:biopolymer transport protein ExbD
VRRSLLPPTNTAAKVNVVPIIDVALVLVVILLITAPVLTVRDMGITLPEARTKSPSDDLKVSITVGKDGQIAVDEDIVPPGGLVAAVGKRIAGTKEDVLVVVRADASMPYATVAQVIRDARAAGAKRLAIAAQPDFKSLPGREPSEPLHAERVRP